VLARYGGYYKVDRCRDCERVIGNTPDIVRYLRENGISEQKAVCIPNFAEVPGGEQITPDTRREVRSELGLSESTIVLLAVGRLHRNKAHDTLLKALAAIPEAVLLVAGDGPLRAKLEQLAVDLGIAPRARFLGWRRDTARLYAAVDISVFPSRFEPYGNVVVECWAQRVPLIAADSTGPKWLVEDGKNGRLFPVDDVNALAAAIRELINNPGLRQTFVENGFHKYRDQFTREAIVQEYLRVFAEALGRVPSRGAGGP
jgi:glycosyltransferase involved in cell wall biosynthesis